MDERSGGSRPAQVDLPILWFLARGAQVLVTVIYAKFAYTSIGTEAFVENFASVVAMLLLIYLFLHRLVTGTADSIEPAKGDGTLLGSSIRGGVGSA